MKDRFADAEWRLDCLNSRMDALQRMDAEGDVDVEHIVKRLLPGAKGDEIAKVTKLVKGKLTRGGRAGEVDAVEYVKEYLGEERTRKRFADAAGDFTTAYEVAIMKGGSVVKRLGFSERKTQGAVLGMVKSNRSAIMAACSKDDLERDTKWDGQSFVFGKVKVGFTGETKKSARGDADDPCWEGYEQAGTKEKGGATVPNCIKADMEPLTRGEA